MSPFTTTLAGGATLALLSLSIATNPTGALPTPAFPTLAPEREVSIGPPTRAGCSEPCSIPDQRPAWDLLRFKASKFMMTAIAEVELVTAEVTLPADLEGEPAPSMRASSSRAGKAKRANAPIYRLDIRSKLLKRRSLSQLWFDPSTGAALRKNQQDFGRRERLKTFRFDANGVQSYRLVPADDRERELGPEGWSDRSPSFDGYPTELVGPEGYEGTVIEPGALFYLISVLDPEKLRAGVEVVAFAGRTLQKVQIRLIGTEQVPARYAIDSGSLDSETGAEAERGNGTVEANVYAVSAKPIVGQDSSFELLGLEGDIEILVEPEHRLPIQVRGRLPPVGKIVVRLEQARLAR